MTQRPRTTLAAAAVPDQERLISYYTAEIADRMVRPVADERQQALAAFIEQCRKPGFRRVLEVGCGVGRDGVPIAGAGLQYTGIDLTPASVEHCLSLGLEALVAAASELPFPAASFDAAWSMSTLMHLSAVKPQASPSRRT